MTCDEAWREVIAEIPLHVPKPAHRVHTFGFRRGLAFFACQYRPLRYLEIGTRLGHSLALVCLAAGDQLAHATAIDAWVGGYAGMRNPGPDAVYDALRRLGVDVSKIDLRTGDSHMLLPGVTGEYDLILVDGDHTEGGARQDLNDAFELLAPVGTIVFDDCDDGLEGNLLRVWEQWVGLMRKDLRDSGRRQRREGVPSWSWATRRKA